MTADEWPTTDRFYDATRAVFAAAAAAQAGGVGGWVRRKLAGRRGPAALSDRKLLLALAGCGRHLWAPLREPGDGRDLEWSARCERVADGVQTRDDLAAVIMDVRVVDSVRTFPYGIAVMAPAEMWRRIDLVEGVGVVPPPVVQVFFPEESALGCDLLRCAWGNPYRPVVVRPDWRSEAAVGLARGMYESQDFSPMPVLADALDDAGCADAEVLAHCRSPGPHVRGCWVVDGLLGKG